jgi:hypothetical protein
MDQQRTASFKNQTLSNRSQVLRVKKDFFKGLNE